MPKDLYHICPSVYHTNFEELMCLGEDFLRLNPSEAKLFMIMGHSYELAVGNRWERFEKFLQLICGQEDIFYGTMRQVLLDVD
jgi:hypothetical protein